MTTENNRSRWRSRVLTLAGSIGLLVFVGLVIALVGWIKLQRLQAAMSVPPPPEMPITVELCRPQPTVFRSSTVVVGSVLADRSVVLRSEETGVVTEVAMSPGGQVKAGDLLIQIDDRFEQAALKSAKATLNQAQAALRRAKKLQLANAYSIEELDVALADSQRAEADVDRFNVLIDRKRITAEFDARVGLFDLHVGQYLEAGTDIVTLEGIADHLHIDFAVPAHVADRIGVGDRVSMRPEESSPPLPAQIIAMNSRADPQSRSLTVRARLDSPPQTLIPGDSVLVTVEYGAAMDAILVPQTAVRRGPTGTTVFVAVPTPSKDGSPPLMRAKSVAVEVAGGDGTMSRIVRGLSLDDQVVTNGSFKVLEGSLLGPIETAGELSSAGVPANTGGEPTNAGEVP